MANPLAPELTVEESRRISTLTEAELDKLPFGTIRLSPEGKVTGFNATEELLTGLRPNDVIGRYFFTEVAPCANVREFAGRFKEGVEKGELHVSFPYVFDFKKKPRTVHVTLFYARNMQNAWVFVRDLSG